MALTDLEVRQAKPRERAYKLRDGDGGLYLLVQPNGARYWRRDYQFEGKRSTAAIGVYARAGSATDKPVMSLRAARDAAAEHRRSIFRGIDPLAQREAEAARAALEAIEAKRALQAERAADRERRRQATSFKAARATTVQRVADDWLETGEPGWTVQHAHQVRQSLQDHVHPKIGHMPITDVGTAEVLDLLSEMLKAGKIETAGRVYQRLGAIWEYAILRKLASADPIKPLSREFSRLKKLARKLNPRRNFAALDEEALPAFLRTMRAYQGDTVTRLGLRLLALTVTRTTELRLATWPEFDLDSDTPAWVIPVDRMKVKIRGDRRAEPHVVPLSRQAVEALRELRKVTGGRGWVFPQSRKRDQPLSENAMLYAIWGMGYKDRMTGHGFRAVASTLLHEAGWPHEAIEAQLAHEKSDETSARYNRAEYLKTRREMMQAYADMLDAIEKTGAKAVPMRGARLDGGTNAEHMTTASRSLAGAGERRQSTSHPA